MNMEVSTRVLFITNKVPHYRLPLYEMLGKEVDLSIAHYGKPTNSELFHEFLCQTNTLGPFIMVKGDFDVSKYDVLVLWGNLRLMNLIIAVKVS